jgi:hypothetical protein
MSVHQPQQINKAEEHSVNLRIEGETWQSFEAKCATVGKDTEEVLKQLMNNYINSSSSLSSVKSPIKVESDLDRLVSDYVNQKIENFLKQQLEVKIANLFEYYLKLHLKQKIQEHLQSSDSSRPTQSTQSEVATGKSKPAIQEQFSAEPDSDELENLFDDFSIEPETPTTEIEADHREFIDSKADTSVRESLTPTEQKKIIDPSSNQLSPSLMSQKGQGQNHSCLKTAKELAKILDISTPYIATLNRIGELQQRGWQDSGHRRGKTILYEPT